MFFCKHLNIPVQNHNNGLDVRQLLNIFNNFQLKEGVAVTDVMMLHSNVTCLPKSTLHNTFYLYTQVSQSKAWI